MTEDAGQKVLRSVFLDPNTDEVLRQAAFRKRISKGELIRMYVDRGILEDQEVGVGIDPVQDKPQKQRKPLSATKANYRPKARTTAAPANASRIATAAKKRTVST